MKNYRITKEHVWGGVIADHKGALAEKLQALSAGGLNLELIIARRESSGRGTLFISPLRTLSELDNAEKAGLAKAGHMRTLRIEAPDVPGFGAKVTTLLADAGINLVGYAALALGGRCVTSIAFDSDADADRARAVLERTLPA
jgi:hypothetical protein